MTGWRLVDEPSPADGAWNMAVDEVLFRAAEEGRAEGPVLRLYAWRPWCLSLGFHQALDEAADEAYCARAGYDVVRRLTGGKAVLHADEVTYSVVAAQDHEAFAGEGLVGTYGAIAEALAAGFRALGLETTLTRRALQIPPRGGAPCFLVPSEREILVAGRKVVGSAQRRGRRAFLQHGAIPLHLDYEELRRATGQDEGELARYRDAFTGVADVMPSIDAEALRAALGDGFRRVFGGPWTPRPLDASEREAAIGLRDGRYATREWTERGREVGGAAEAL